LLFVNGLPLVVIELKNAADENAQCEKCLTNSNLQGNHSKFVYLQRHLQYQTEWNVKQEVFRQIYSRYMTWKTADGSKRSITI
jgi:type I restriction enzyme R subunit